MMFPTFVKRKGHYVNLLKCKSIWVRCNELVFEDVAVFTYDNEQEARNALELLKTAINVLEL